MTSPDSVKLRGTGSSRVAEYAIRSDRFVNRQVAHILYRETERGSHAPRSAKIVSEAQFWQDSDAIIGATVRLNGFKITDWFPRAPGVYSSARAARSETNSAAFHPT